MQEEINEKVIALYIKGGKAITKGNEDISCRNKKTGSKAAASSRKAKPKAAYETECRRFQH